MVELSIVFIIPKDKIEELMHIANNILSPQIRFTYETLDRQTDVGLSFLDTLLFITEEGKIVSRLYTKKTDKHAYLLPSSYHPLHVTNNIPQAVFNRIRRLCSKDEWYEEDAGQAVEWLSDRGYNQINIKKAAENSRKKEKKRRREEEKSKEKRKKREERKKERRRKETRKRKKERKKKEERRRK